MLNKEQGKTLIKPLIISVIGAVIGAVIATGLQIYGTYLWDLEAEEILSKIPNKVLLVLLLAALPVSLIANILLLWWGCRLQGKLNKRVKPTAFALRKFHN